MVDELEFRKLVETALDKLLHHLILLEEDEGAGFEVEGQGGLLNIIFDDPPAKFVITPNTPVRQIWISALSTSFKLDWDDAAAAFVLPRTGEHLEALVERLIKDQFQS